jgi:outer membrane usher protein
MLNLATLTARAAEQTLMLDVQVNGYSIDKIGEFTLRDGVLMAQEQELHDLGFQVPNPVVKDANGLILLSELPGLTWRFDPVSQTLYVTGGNDRLLPELLHVEGGKSGGALESGTGVTINYDIIGNASGGMNTASSSLDMRVFSPWGVASTGLLAYAGGGPRGRDADSAIRLDSTYTYSDDATLRRYRLGDVITGGLSWTRPVRLGGLQAISDFSMRPDLVTFPLPSVSGSVAVPSTLDVFVNGTRLLSRDIGAGPFEIPQLPVVTGAGAISMAVTNALGKQVTTTLPFYASSTLLAPGLQTFSAQAGAVRRNWGTVSNDYGSPAASATYRRGVSSWLTLEGSAEGASGLSMGGAGIVVDLDNIAVLNAAAAGSTGGGHTGEKFAVGIQRTGIVFSLGASATMAGKGFRDIAAINGDLVPRLQLNANAGMSLGRFGSVGIAYAQMDSYVQPNAVPFYIQPYSPLSQDTTLYGGTSYLEPAQHAKVMSASYSFQIGDVSMYATGFRDFSNGRNGGGMVGLTIPLGARSSAGASAGFGSGGRSNQVQAQQSAVTIGDFGYQAYASGSGGTTHEFAQAIYKSPWMLVDAGVSRMGRETSLQAESQGAISYVDGSIFASNPINDSFAVVDTNGLENVRVLYENRDAGSTDKEGQLLVPDLRSFDINHIAIEPNDIAPDTTIDVTARDVRPQDRSGVVVKFAVKISHAALLRLVDNAGAPIPLGSTATLRATGIVVPVGYDGEAYVQDLAPHNELTVERMDSRRCIAKFDYTAIRGEIPSIGPLQCVE